VALERLRGRMPLLAFLLLAILCLALLGLACACFSDQLALAFERVLHAPVALVEVWPSLALVALGVAPLVVLVVPATGRASPALLHRYLF
jgi:ABC-type enterochelin transport system permease subunit